MLTKRLFRLINTQNREQTERVDQASLMLIHKRRMLLLDTAEDGEGKMRLHGYWRREDRDEDKGNNEVEGGIGGEIGRMKRGITRLGEVLKGRWGG
jgi:hypothetical protein